jgi:hypothetical protein
MKGVGTALRKYTSNVTLPYQPGSTRPVDVIAHITIQPTYEGSGWNFLINFPGFLIWTPAWHGYNYNVKYDVAITLMDGPNKRQLDSWKMPIDLHVRHADIDRTWTEISWLEVGAIAFVGGICFIQYDSDVTPLLLDKIENPIGDYIAQEIIHHFNGCDFRKAPTAVLASTPAKEKAADNSLPPKIKVVRYEYDTKSQKGTLSVDISETGLAMRDWVVSNIGKIASSKEVLIEAGQEASTGGKYRLLNESIKDGVLTVEFTAGYAQ